MKTRIISLLVVPILIEILFVTWLIYLLSQTEQRMEKAQAAADLGATVSRMSSFYVDASTALIGYQYMHRPEELQDFHTSVERGLAEERRLRLLAQKYEDFSREINDILKNAATARSHFPLLLKGIENYDSLVELKEYSILKNMTADCESWDAHWRDTQERERILHPLNEQQSLKTLISACLIATVVTTAILVYFFLRDFGKRIAIVTTNCAHVGAGLPLLPMPPNADEIGLVDSTIRTMKDSIEAYNHQQRAIINNAGDVILSIGGDLRFADVNPAAERLWGYTPQELIGMYANRLLTDSEKQAFSETLNAARKSGKETTIETTLALKNQKESYCVWSVNWAEAEQSYFCVVHDITERKRAEQMREDMIQMISHDLRSPLTTVHTSLELVVRSLSEVASQADLQRLNRAIKNCKKMFGLTNDLLDIQKIEAGALKIDTKPIPIESLMEQSMYMVIREDSAVSVEIKPCDAIVIADEQRIEQVIMNLLSNAIKFSPANTCIILSAVERDGEVVVSIKDRGRGVPAAMLESIFERFRQVDISDAVQRQGSGLGLAICKALIGLHGGRIWCESSGEEGSTFSFTLPKYTPPE